MTPYVCNCLQPLGWGQYSAFPQGTGAPYPQREYYCTHISAWLPGVTQVIRNMHDCELQVSKRCTEQLFTALSIWSLPFPRSVKMSQQLNFTPAFVLIWNAHLQHDSLHQDSTPSNANCILGVRLKAGATGIFEQGFSDPTFSCWGKERNPLPSHGWVKQPLYSRRAAPKPKAAKGGVQELSQDATVIS